MVVSSPPPTGTGAYTIKQAIEDAIARLDGLEAIPESLEAIGEAVGAAAGAAAGTAGGVAAVDTAESAGIAAVDMGGWLVLLVVVAILIIMRLVEQWVEWLAGNIPIYGPRIKHSVVIGFYWIDKVENAVILLMEESAKHLLHSIRLLVFFSLGVDPQALANLLGQTHQQGGSVTQAQVNHLQAEINYLRQHMGVVQYVTQDHTIVTPIPQNLWDQLHHVEAQVQLLHQDMLHVVAIAQQALHTANSVQQQQSILQNEVHEVRAIAVGWQDIATELDTLGTTVTHFVNATTEELATHTREIAHAQPLNLLLQPGIAGLRNLRKLEDNMCQCPKLPGFPSLMPDRLAVYEFITNG